VCPRWSTASATGTTRARAFGLRPTPRRTAAMGWDPCHVVARRSVFRPCVMLPLSVGRCGAVGRGFRLHPLRRAAQLQHSPARTSFSGLYRSGRGADPPPVFQHLLAVSSSSATSPSERGALSAVSARRGEVFAIVRAREGARHPGDPHRRLVAEFLPNWGRDAERSGSARAVPSRLPVYVNRADGRENGSDQRRVNCVPAHCEVLKAIHPQRTRAPRYGRRRHRVLGFGQSKRRAPSTTSTCRMAGHLGRRRTSRGGVGRSRSARPSRGGAMSPSTPILSAIGISSTRPPSVRRGFTHHGVGSRTCRDVVHIPPPPPAPPRPPPPPPPPARISSGNAFLTGEPLQRSPRRVFEAATHSSATRCQCSDVPRSR